MKTGTGHKDSNTPDDHKRLKSPVLGPMLLPRSSGTWVAMWRTAHGLGSGASAWGLAWVRLLVSLSLFRIRVLPTFPDTPYRIKKEVFR